MTAGAFELCGICGHALRVGVRFCSRCGAEQGLAVPRDAGAGREVHEPAPLRRLHVGQAGLLIALVVYFASFAPLLVLQLRSWPTLSDAMWAELFIGAVGIAGMLAMRRDTLPLLRAPTVRLVDLGLAAGGILVTLGVVIVLEQLVPWAFIEDTLWYRVEGRSLGYAILHGAVLPGIAEELAFRGVVLTALCAVFRERTAVLVSAMLFAIIHVSPIGFIHLTLLGVLLGAARLRTGSLWPCIAIHIAYNALVLSLQW